MALPLNVLIVEHRDDEAEVLVQELRRSGFNPDWQRVDTEADYLKRLQQGVDVVLSSYDLPQFGGLRALDLLKQGGLEIPLIFMADTLGENAVTAMKQGATDCLFKSQLSRLGESVTQALASRRLRAERRRAEQLILLQSTALETVANGIVITDVQGVILLVNPAFTALTGYAADEVVGKTPRLLKSGKHAPQFYENLWATILAGLTWRGCMTNRRKDGSFYLDEHTITPVRSNEGVVTHFVAVMNDVTERHAAEEALRRKEDKYRTIFENARDGIFQTTPEGNFLAINPAMARILGYASPEELVRERRDIAQQGYVDPRNREEFKRRIESDGVVNGFEYEAWRKDGGKVWVSENARLVRDQAGRVTYYEGSMEDITARKAAETKLLEQLDELRRWHEAMLGREERALQLKCEVNELCRQLGRPVRYPSQDPAAEAPPST